MNRDVNYGEKNGLAAERFGSSFNDPEDRLVAIMKNIIKHDGLFKPEAK